MQRRGEERTVERWMAWAKLFELSMLQWQLVPLMDTDVWSP